MKVHCIIELVALLVSPDNPTGICVQPLNINGSISSGSNFPEFNNLVSTVFTIVENIIAMLLSSGQKTGLQNDNNIAEHFHNIRLFNPSFDTTPNRGYLTIEF